MSQSNESNQSNIAGDLLKDVSDVLSSSIGTVRSRFKDMLVERAISSRVDTLDKGIIKVQEAERELRKVKPDLISISSDGTRSENWSKEQYEKKAKAEETLQKLRNAVERALSGEGFDKLSELVK